MEELVHVGISECGEQSTAPYTETVDRTPADDG
jgi:hypothetical protein